jgi:hypothetical protein
VDNCPRREVVSLGDAGRCLAGRRGQGAVEIGDQVIGILDPDGDPHHVGRSARGLLLFGGQLPVGGGGRMDDQAPRVAEIGDMAEDLELSTSFTQAS